MSIALVIPGRKLTGLVEQLQTLLPDVLIQQWPEVSAPEEVLMAVVWKQPPGSLKAFKQLKVLQSFGAGVDTILLDEELPWVPLCRIVDPHLTRSMQQYLHSVVGYYRQRLDQFSNQQATSLWKPKSPRPLKHIAVLGLGELGAAAALSFVQQGYQVSGWSASRKTLEGVSCYSGEAEFQLAVMNADVVICLLPLTETTNNLLNAQRFAFFKPSAIFINVARGAIVDDAALLNALNSEHLEAACLDVFREEPLPKENIYWQHPKILVTPHCSAVTDAKTAVYQIVQNYKNMLNKVPLLNEVDRVKGY